MDGGDLATHSARTRSPIIAAIVTTFNRPESLAQTLASLTSQSIAPKQVVVVGSTQVPISTGQKDDICTRGWIFLECPESNQKAQRDLGIQSLRSNFEWIAFIDDDLVLEPNYMEEMSLLIERIKGSPAGFGGIINSEQNPVRYRVVNAPQLESKIKTSNITSYGRPRFVSTRGEPIHVDWISTPGSIWHVEILGRIKHRELPGRYRMYEDVLFSLEVAKGYPLILNPKARGIEVSVEFERHSDRRFEKSLAYAVNSALVVRDGPYTDKFRHLLWILGLACQRFFWALIGQDGFRYAEARGFIHGLKTLIYESLRRKRQLPW